MGRRRIAQFVDGLHDRVERRVVTDRGVRTAQVVIDRTGQPHDGNVVLLREDIGARQRAVAADDHQCVDTGGFQVFIGLLTPLDRFELLAASRFEDRSAQLDDVAYGRGVEIDDFVRHQTAVTAQNSLDRKSVVDGRAGNGADGGVHAWGVAAGGQDTDAFDGCHSERSIITSGQS